MSPLAVNTLALLLLAGAPVMAQERSWIQEKAEFLGPSRSVLMHHCAKGRIDNKAGLSLFNDAWVKKIRRLRFLAGVDSEQGSQVFFAGLSAAVNTACPGVW